MIYNPYFEKHGIDAVVVPMGVKAEDYPDFLKLLFRLSNIHGALVTMPHKVTTVALLDEVTTTARSPAPATPSRRPDGALVGDMFDGEGFVRGVLRKGRTLAGQCPRGRRRRRRLGDRGLAAEGGRRRLGLFDAHAADVGPSPAPPRALSGAEVRPARTIRPATTSWSTPRRSA